MTDAIQELKVRAEILHGRLERGEPEALARLRALPEFRRMTATDLQALVPTLKRRHGLSVVAAELGFPSWPLAKAALGGDGGAQDFGDLVCPTRCAIHTNLWYARYEEAAAVRRSTGRYLLAYRRQFLVVDRHYIETLGLDPRDPDWEALGFDWARPRDVAARSRLYAKLLAGLPREAA